VTDREIKNLIAKNRFLNLTKKLTEVEARRVATGIAVKRIYKQYRAKHALSFHASITGAQQFADQQDKLNGMLPRAKSFHVNSEMTAGTRRAYLDKFKASPRALMTNARCLQEGIDVPAIDCVVFADPRQSATDIIQAAGRAMRKSPGKKCGYILVPIVIPEKTNFETYAKTTAFRTVMRVIVALSTQDTRIADELRAIRYGKISKGKIIRIDGKLPIGLNMPLDKFAKAIRVKMWERVGRVAGVYWRPFEEARDFARKLRLRSLEQWKVFARSSKRPNDIPMAPDNVYFNIGWKGWADFLGTRNRKGGWRSSEEASKFARKLRLRSQKEWFAWVRLGKLPDDVPANPQSVYANDGWKGWGYFLGTNRAARQRGNWLSFKEARYVARKLRLQSMQEWLALVRSPKRPKNIPANPSSTYKNAGWISWADFLSINRDWRPFRKARAFARKLKLNSYKEWTAYCRTGKRPNDIPFTPDRIYADTGWAGWGDWLGNSRRRGNWRPFEKARALVRGLKLKSGRDWHEYCRSGKKPDDIPSNPASVYADTGWIGTCDWLGGGRRRVVGCRSFMKARAFVRGLKLKDWDDWREYCRSGKKPNDIPSTPQEVYADAGWAGLGDWLGNGRACEWRNFIKARAFVRKLGLKSTAEWQAYCRSGKKPNDIPYAPHHLYADTGWVGYGDWLGNGRRRGTWRNFIEARAFARQLKLSSYKEWTAYCRTGKRPNDIPSSPNIIYADTGWAGWGDWLEPTCVVLATGVNSRKRAPSRGDSNSIIKKSGSHIAAAGKNPMIFRVHRRRCMQKPVGPASTIGSTSPWWLGILRQKRSG
jgi:hypothetical protein